MTENDRMDSAAETVNGSDADFRNPSRTMAPIRTDFSTKQIPVSSKSPAVEIVRPGIRQELDLDDYFV